MTWYSYNWMEKSFQAHDEGAHHVQSTLGAYSFIHGIELRQKAYGSHPLNPAVYYVLSTGMPLPAVLQA